MKNVRLIMLGMAVVVVVATAISGFALGVVWSVVVAAAGIMLVVMTAGFVQTQTLQTVTQRLAGLQQQNARTAETVLKIHAMVSKYPSGSPLKLPKDAERAFEDLTLASRSLTVPQAHFDQLLRTISANTVRTESALNDAIDEMRVIAEGASSTSTVAPSGEQGK